jgi:hypothetical protein
MKEIMIASIIVAFVGVAMIVFALEIVSCRNDAMTRKVIEQTDFEVYEFITPDGHRFRPIDGFHWLEV